MKLDSEDQRKILLAIIDQGNYPGQVVDAIASLKHAIRLAPLDDSVSSPVTEQGVCNQEAIFS